MRVLDYFRDLKITSKLIVISLLSSLIPLLLISILNYSITQKTLKKELISRIVSISNYKETQIRSTLQEKLNTLFLIPDFGTAIEKLYNVWQMWGRGSLEYKSLEKEYIPMFNYYKKYGYDNFYLVSDLGEIIFSLDKDTVEQEGKKILLETIEKVKKSFSPQISRFFLDANKKKAVCLMVIPYITNTGKFNGALMGEVSTDIFYNFVKDYSSLGKTGEVLLCLGEKDKIIIPTPLRFSSQEDKSIKELIEKHASIALKMSLKGEGWGVSYDYRKEKVFSVWKYLEDIGLGLVVKMDIKEVFAPLYRLRDATIIITILISIIVVVLSIKISSTISQPLRDLTSVAEIIASGDLNKRVFVQNRDEIGKLAASFNAMADSLVEAKERVEKDKEMLEQKQVLLEKANKELDSFVYTVSHDLRAPLRGIYSFATFLEEDYKEKLEEKAKEYIIEIKKGAQRMNKLIDDLLALSRISRIKNPFEKVEIKEIVDSVLERIKLDIKNTQTEIVIKPLPCIWCDRIKLEEVFLNLINNAIKFSSKLNDRKPKIEIGCEDKGEEYEFYVRDNGVGIPKEYQQDIFGIFKRLHSSEYEGTGVGLSIVKRVIEEHKGRITVESQVGEGTTFYFTIPKVLKQDN